MDKNTNPAASAESLAANFQVSELEPRLENLWGEAAHDHSEEHATPASGATP